MADFEKCISVSFEEPYIIVANNCEDEIVLDSVEVRYYIQVRVPTRRDEVLEERAVRKEITERIKDGERIPSGGNVKVYFGSVSNITSVTAVVKRDDKLYRVSGGLQSPSSQ